MVTRGYPVRMSAVVSVVVWAASVHAQGEPVPLKMHPPNSMVHGKTIGEWGAIWWQWVNSIPNGMSPVKDDRTGELCHKVPDEPVHFLFGNFGGVDHRSCTIEAGKDILVPVFNYAEYNIPPENSSLPQLVNEAALLIDQATNLQLTLNGVQVPQETLLQHREPFASFVMVLPENNVSGEPAGTYDPVVSDGFYVMLEPLPVGTHEIRTHAEWKGEEGTPCLACDVQSCNFLFCLTVTYTLTVVPARFRRGDANGDGSINITDPISILDGLFLGGDPPACHDAADSNDDGLIDLADPVSILGMLFLGANPLSPPGPGACGPDPTDDALVACAKRCVD